MIFDLSFLDGTRVMSSFSICSALFAAFGFSLASVGAHMSRLHHILISFLILQEMAEVKEEAGLLCSYNMFLLCRGQ